MKKRLFAILLALCLTISIMPAAFAADEGSLTADQDGKITLTADTTATLTVQTSETITLDLAGFTLTNPEGSHTIMNHGTLTIMDSSEGKTGKVDNVSHQRAPVYNYPNATVILEGGTFTRSQEASTSATDSGKNSFYTLKNFGTMTIKDGVTVNQGADGNGKFSSLVANGYQDGKTHDGLKYEDYGTPTLTIDGGTFNGGLNTIKNDDYGVLTINGGEFKNVAQAAFLNWNVATITNGSFTSDQNCILNGGGDETLDKGELTIEGGDFTCGEGSSVLAAMNGNSSYLSAEKIQVSGGTFSDRSVEDFVVEGKILDSNGSVVPLNEQNAAAKIGEEYYVTLQEAVNAVQDNETIEIVRDGKGGFYVGNNKDNPDWAAGTTKTFTIDFKGHKYDLAPTVGSEGTKTNGVQLLKDNTVTMTNGTLYSTQAKLLIQNYCNLTLDKMTLNASGAYASSNNNGTVVIQDTIINAASGQCAFDVYSFGSYTGANVTIKGDSVINGKIEVGHDADVNISNLKLNIESGKFKGEISASGAAAGVDNFLKDHVAISGGIFSSDPSAYCAENLTGVANDDPATSGEYPFKIGEAKATAAEVTAGTPEVTLPASLETNQIAKDAKEALAGTAEGSAPATIAGAGLEAAAKELANNNTENPDDYKDELGVTDDTKTVTIVVEHYIDIKVTGAEEAEDGSKTLTLDITPKAQKYATTADLDKNEEINADDSDPDAKNAVKIGKPETLTITAPVTITLPLPADFAADGDLNVKHIKSSSKTYIYTGTVSSNVLTFTNPNGFSTFILGAEAPAAVIGDVGYESLQAAVDEVKDGETITLNESGTATVANKTIRFTVKCENGAAATIKDFQGTTLTPDSNGVYTVTQKSTGGGGGGGGVTSYPVTVAAAEHGKVEVSPKSAGRNSIVTITVTPDQGYALDKIVVLDKDGKEIELTDKGGGKFTFRMPASKVEISATFAEAGAACSGGRDCPSYLLTDVDAGKWYHDAVDYVVTHGLMQGTSATSFEPNTTTSRGMIVTILYRLEGEPETADTSFDDVAEGRYCTNAVAWAAANGIVNGYGNGSFGPDDTITREQMAAILYRYAAYKGYDVAARANLAGYTDADQISAYAVDAIAWANAEGLVNGTSTTTMDPAGNATRAQVAAILMRFCENAAK